MSSSLPLFAGVEGELVVLYGAGTPRPLVEAAIADAEMLGFQTVRSASLPQPQAAVA